MAKKIKYEEIIKRQAHASNPLMGILIGATIHLEEAASLVKALNENEDGSPISPTLTDASKRYEDFLKSMEESELFHSMILKLQLPLSSNVKNPGLLAYNEAKTLMEELTVDEGVLRFFDEGEVKVYVRARLWIDGTLQLVERVEPQAW